MKLRGCALGCFRLMKGRLGGFRTEIDLLDIGDGHMLGLALRIPSSSGLFAVAPR